MDRRIAKGVYRRKKVHTPATKKAPKRKRRDEEDGDSSSSGTPPKRAKNKKESNKRNKQNFKKKNKKPKNAFALPKIDQGNAKSGQNSQKHSPKSPSLSDQINKFANYVRLDDKEIEVRESFVNVVRNVVHKHYPTAQVTVFGSFATLPVCNFISDVDITISNAFEMPKPRTTRPTSRPEKVHQHPKASKQQLLKKKWLSALEQIDNFEAGGTGTESDPIFISSASDDDTADPLKRDRLDSIESVDLNFSTSPEAPTSSEAPKSSAKTKKPNILIRRQVQDCLSSLRRRLHNLKSVKGIQFIANARVPILKIRTIFSIQADICIREGQLTDTTLFASDCVSAHGDRFSNAVIVLKMLLYQQGLDEPYTGGLGSFKLYALMSAYLSKRPTDGENVGEVLLGFLAGFQYARDIYRFDLKHSKNTEVDLTSVFRLDDIIELFQISLARLIEHQRLSTILSMSDIRSERSRLRGLSSSSANSISLDVIRWCGAASADTASMKVAAVDQSLVAAR